MTGLLTVLLWPSKSFASMIPACENDFFSGTLAPPPPSAEEVDESCADGPFGDDIDNSRGAPICDARGASAIALGRLRAVSDAAFDRGHGCGGGETLRASAGPTRGDPPIQPPDTTYDRAVLPAVTFIAPAMLVTVLDPLAPTGGPRAGVRDDVYHPPR